MHSLGGYRGAILNATLLPTEQIMGMLITNSVKTLGWEE